MKELSNATERFKLASWTSSCREFGGTLQHVETASKELGLRECAAHHEHVFLPDAVRAPVFAQQLANLTAGSPSARRRSTASVSTPQAIAQNLASSPTSPTSTPRRLDDLKPPVLGDGGSPTTTSRRCATSATVFDKGAKRCVTPITSLAEADRLDAQLTRAYRTERKAIKKLLKGIGAIPRCPAAAVASEAPAGEEEQSA